MCRVLQVKNAKVDTLVMKHFLSGFSDNDAKLILKHCKEVLPKEANILLLQVRIVDVTIIRHGVVHGMPVSLYIMSYTALAVWQKSSAVEVVYLPLDRACVPVDHRARGRRPLAQHLQGRRCTRYTVVFFLVTILSMTIRAFGRCSLSAAGVSNQRCATCRPVCN